MWKKNRKKYQKYETYFWLHKVKKKMNKKNKIGKCISVLPTKNHNATLFLFHGSCASDEDIKLQLDSANNGELKFPHTKIVYPLAPLQPYTLLGGMVEHVWFDRLQLSIKAPEVQESINKILNLCVELIKNEVESGIPLNKIGVGGFSMGGCLSMYLAYQSELNDLAFCTIFSSFLNEKSQLYETLKENVNRKLPPLLQFHGTDDNLVPFKWSETTFNTLKSFGVKGEFVKIPGADHEITEAEIIYFKKWISQIL